MAPMRRLGWGRCSCGCVVGDELLVEGVVGVEVVMGSYVSYMTVFEDDDLVGIEHGGIGALDKALAKPEAKQLAENCTNEGRTVEAIVRAGWYACVFRIVEASKALAHAWHHICKF